MGDSPNRTRHGGLIVEFTGVTGVGKSTLIAAVQEVLSGEGFAVAEAQAALRSCYGCEWGGYPILQKLAAHLWALPPFLQYAATGEGRQLARLVWRLIARDAGDFLSAVRLARNFMKRVGVHRLLQDPTLRRRFDYLLCDEGIVHTAHNLFVHVRAAPRHKEIERFVTLLPLPDVVIWITAPLRQSLAVTLQRGHPRVAANPAAAQAFVEHGRATFEVVGASPAIQNRLLQIDNGVLPGNDCTSVIHERARRIGEFLKGFRGLRGLTPPARQVLP